MKNVRDTIVKNRFFTTKRLLGMFLVIATLFFVACEVTEETTTKTTQKVNTFSYSDVIVEEGSTTTAGPTWDGDFADQEVTYEIVRVDGNPVASGISIDTSTGDITVTTSATRSIPDAYTVTATGTGEYAGTTVETTLSIWVQPSFTYGQVMIIRSTSITQSAPSGQDFTTSTFALQEQTEGLSIDSTSGEVTIVPLLPNTTNMYVNAGTYVIEITEAGATYGVGIEIVYPQPTTKTELTGFITDARNTDGDEVNLNFIDTSLITDMQNLFFSDATFNGDISGWDVSNVVDMGGLFLQATAFNGDISGWDVSSVDIMTSMFDKASVFNGDISGWDVSGVISMSAMFQEAAAFNQNLPQWDTRSVLTMGFMFSKAVVFNGDISGWDVSSVTDMSSMFNGASVFNQDLNWDVSNVTTMRTMFQQAFAFNGNVTQWSVGNVTDMAFMFYGKTDKNVAASVFNQNISGWTVSSVTDMSSMFNGAGAFNQNLDAWGVSSGVTKPNMFDDSGLAGSEPTWYTNPTP